MTQNSIRPGGSTPDILYRSARFSVSNTARSKSVRSSAPRIPEPNKQVPKAPPSRAEIKLARAAKTAGVAFFGIGFVLKCASGFFPAAAPLIGLTALLCLTLFALSDASLQIRKLIIHSRPTRLRTFSQPDVTPPPHKPRLLLRATKAVADFALLGGIAAALAGAPPVAMALFVASTSLSLSVECIKAGYDRYAADWATLEPEAALDTPEAKRLATWHKSKRALKVVASMLFVSAASLDLAAASFAGHAFVLGAISGAAYVFAVALMTIVTFVRTR